MEIQQKHIWKIKLPTCCRRVAFQACLRGVSREEVIENEDGRVFSLFLSSFPRGWIFKGSGLNLRSGIRGQTRIAKQPISVLFSSSPYLLCYNKLEEEEKEKEQGGKLKVEK